MKNGVKLVKRGSVCELGYAEQGEFLAPILLALAGRARVLPEQNHGDDAPPWQRLKSEQSNFRLSPLSSTDGKKIRPLP